MIGKIIHFQGLDEVKELDKVKDLIVEGNIIFDPYQGLCSGLALSIGRINPKGTIRCVYHETFEEPTLESVIEIKYSSGCEEEQILSEVREIALSRGLALESCSLEIGFGLDERPHFYKRFVKRH